MPWKKIPLLTRKQESDFERKFRGRSRFLIDHNFAARTREHPKQRGFNAVTARDIKAESKSDEDVLAVAMRDRRILLTSDRDFLDEHRFPAHRNPGIVVLPAASRDYWALITAFFTILPLVGKYPPIWRQSLVQVTGDGVITITDRDHKSGARTSTRYRYTSAGPEQWTD
jgi:hypothetical protein